MGGVQAAQRPVARGGEPGEPRGYVLRGHDGWRDRGLHPGACARRVWPLPGGQAGVREKLIILYFLFLIEDCFKDANDTH